jgi:hypothetical protein
VRVAIFAMTFEISRHRSRTAHLSCRKGGAPSSLHIKVNYERGILSSCRIVKQRVLENRVSHPPLKNHGGCGTHDEEWPTLREKQNREGKATQELRNCQPPNHSG